VYVIFIFMHMNGDAIAQAAVRRIRAAEAPVRAHVSLCGTSCGL
jgi:hypothetical protein